MRQTAAVGSGFSSERLINTSIDNKHMLSGLLAYRRLFPCS